MAEWLCRATDADDQGGIGGPIRVRWHIDAYRQIGRFLEEVYMHKRFHSSLVYLPPAEFESR
jgi:transposase InsO family protein